MKNAKFSGYYFDRNKKCKTENVKMLLLQINYLKEKQNWKCKNVAVVAGKKHVKHLCMVK